MRKHKKVFSMLIMFGMLFGVFLPVATVSAAGENLEIKQEAKTFQEDVTSNLMVDSEGRDLVNLTQDKKLYELDKVEITRYRQKVRIEYYLGDYASNSFIGADEGYGDYDDSVSDYVMTIPSINEKFGQSIPTAYRLVPYSATDRSVYSDVPAYSGTDETYTVKVLIAEVKRYSVSAAKYQNRQDLPAQPNPIGKSKSAIEGLSEYWKVNTLSTSFNAVVGQEINLKNVGGFDDTYTSRGRMGELSYYGMYDSSGNFTDLSTFVVPSGLTGTVSLAGFYAVDDLGSAVVNPGSSSSMTSGAGIGFYGNDLTWKSEKVSELLLLSDSTQAQKLAAYPFHLAEDPFDEPEYPATYWTPANFALGHRLDITYYYTQTGTLLDNFTVTFESNGGSLVEPIEAVLEGSTITGPVTPTYVGYTFGGWYKDVGLETLWDFENDLVLGNMTLYAKWLPTGNDEKKDPGTSVTKNNEPSSKSAIQGEVVNLPKTGNNSLWIVGLSLLLIGSGVAVKVYRLQKHK